MLESGVFESKEENMLLFFALKLPLGLAIKAVGVIRTQEYTYKHKGRLQ